MNIEKLLFIDTETNEDTQAIDCITYLIGDKKDIIEDFNEESYKLLRDLWFYADGVVFFNAPFDMGVLSNAYEYNGYEWVEQIDEDSGVVSSFWELTLFEQVYKVKKLTYTANLIQPKNYRNGTPVIDLLKLWYLLIETGGNGVKIGLKALIERHLDWEPIPYTKENAKREDYRYQDVDAPKQLMRIFFDKIKGVKALHDFTAKDWGSIKSSASFSKIFYKRHYKKLRVWQEENDDNVSKYKLSAALEKAYHGGLTYSFFRGELENCAWIDIKGAYANTMKFLNTDQYLKFDVEKVDKFDMESPYLLYVKSNFMFDLIENGLKTYYVHKPCNNWIWNYDIKSIENLIDDYEYEIIEIFKIIPQNDVSESLPAIWDNLKNIEEKDNGKSTLYFFYKLLSNSSYGIKAQRIPSRTEHTNMAVAGIVTSRAHLILTTINKTLRDNGYEIVYNDTDSACFHFTPKSMNAPFDLEIVNKINKVIHPFVVDCEGVFAVNKFLSLKRYVCFDSEQYENANKKLVGYVPEDKVRVHGKGAYDITEDEMFEVAIDGGLSKGDRLLNIKQFVGSTKRTLKRIKIKFPEFEANLRPFMFTRNHKSETWLSTYLNHWVEHIDKKLVVKTGTKYFRPYRKFLDRDSAVIFYNNISKGEPVLYGGNMSDAFIQFDASEKELSSESVAIIDQTEICVTRIPKHIDPMIIKFCDICKSGLIPGENISKNRYKKHNYLCDNCFIPKLRKPTKHSIIKKPSIKRSKNEIIISKKEKQKTGLELINKINDKNKLQDTTMKQMELERKEADKRMKAAKKRIMGIETEYQKKLQIKKDKKKNVIKKPKPEKKIKKDEKKFCNKCGILLNPYVNGNITMRSYKAYKYTCLECNAKMLEQKRIIKNSR